MTLPHRPMGTGPSANTEPEQSSGFVLTCALTALALLGLVYLGYLLRSSPGTISSGEPGDSETTACPALVFGDLVSFTVDRSACVPFNTQRLVLIVIAAIPTVAVTAVALGRWISHMGFGAKVLRVG